MNVQNMFLEIKDELNELHNIFNEGLYNVDENYLKDWTTRMYKLNYDLGNIRDLVNIKYYHNNS